ncbi:MAG TPA: hypothetical protein VFY16_06135 [Gemmatimonadaceae bacterium]|nr:hypothetical protein [Gemmatimonadaceae bacterium]
MGRPLPKDHKHTISLPDAAKATKRQRKEKDPKKKGMEHPYAFRREPVDEILSQPRCVGLRFYPCLHEDGRPSVVVVGVDEEGNDMTMGTLIDEAMVCPPYCSDGNELNSDS